MGSDYTERTHIVLNLLLYKPDGDWIGFRMILKHRNRPPRDWPLKMESLSNSPNVYHIKDIMKIAGHLNRHMKKDSKKGIPDPNMVEILEMI